MKRQHKNEFSQRQLRVGEMIKQSLGQIFLRGEAKVPTLRNKQYYGYRSKNESRFKKC